MIAVKKQSNLYALQWEKPWILLIWSMDSRKYENQDIEKIAYWESNWLLLLEHRSRARFHTEFEKFKKVPI